MPTRKPGPRCTGRIPSLLALAFLAGGLIPAPGFAAGAYDGTYNGPMTPAPGNHPSCTKNARATLTIRNNHLTYVHFGGNATIETEVASDGSFKGQALNQYLRHPDMQFLEGKISGRVIEGETSNRSCAFHLTLLKRS